MKIFMWIYVQDLLDCVEEPWMFKERESIERYKERMEREVVRLASDYLNLEVSVEFAETENQSKNFRIFDWNGVEFDHIHMSEYIRENVESFEETDDFVMHDEIKISVSDSENNKNMSYNTCFNMQENIIQLLKSFDYFLPDRWAISGTDGTRLLSGDIRWNLEASDGEYRQKLKDLYLPWDLKEESISANVFDWLESLSWSGGGQEMRVTSRWTLQALVYCDTVRIENEGEWIDIVKGWTEYYVEADEDAILAELGLDDARECQHIWDTSRDIEGEFSTYSFNGGYRHFSHCVKCYLGRIDTSYNAGQQQDNQIEFRLPDYSAVWDDLTSPVEIVFDEEGFNVSEGKVRKMPNEGYLYVDEVNGYILLTEEEYERLITGKEENYE